MKVKPRRLAEQEFTYFRGQDNLEYYAGLLVEAKAEAGVLKVGKRKFVKLLLS